MPVSLQAWMVLRAIVGEVWAPLTRMAEPPVFERSHCSMRQLPCVTSISASVRPPPARSGSAPPPASSLLSALMSRQMATFASRMLPRISSEASAARRRMVKDAPQPMISTSWSICSGCCTECSPARSLMPNGGMRLPGGVRTPLMVGPVMPPTGGVARAAARVVPRWSASAKVAASHGTTISQQTSLRKRSPPDSGFTSGSRRDRTPESRMSFRRLWFGMRVLFASGSPVIGDVDFSASHASMCRRSYVWPSQVLTASRMTSFVMGQRNSWGTSDSFTPPTLPEDPASADTPPSSAAPPRGSATCARIHRWNRLPPPACASLTRASRPPAGARDSLPRELGKRAALPSRTRQYCPAASNSRASAGRGLRPPPSRARRSRSFCISLSVLRSAWPSLFRSPCVWGSSQCWSS
mmetsp:Transcript_109533/g.309873  ORF Transcript_109533/g.309873 Transcript_109533/m.309873 type:complete len:411 (-) Transcript_109533:249-1481(-)